MMQFLTKTLSNPSKKQIQELEDKVSRLEKIVAQQSSSISELNSNLSDYAKVNQILCSEVTMMAKFISRVAKLYSFDSDGDFQLHDTGDDEYLN